MNSNPEKHKILFPFFNRLAVIFADMDQAYLISSRHYNFCCKGCDENCCMTHFFHHTHIEYFYILEGIRKLGSDLSASLFKKANEINQKTISAIQQGDKIRLMCPLNSNGMCVIYNHRPMICRMHGIPHELNIPGKQTVFGTGCKAFEAQCEKKQYLPFDRTPFYVSIANLEKDIKQQLGIKEKFKKTIAQMLDD
jgi:Fe-S-cluster containining protein